MTLSRSHRTIRPLGRALAPQSPDDYNFLASAAACRHLSPREVASYQGFDGDRAERLIKSTSSQSFMSWLVLQGSLAEGFRLIADFARELDLKSEQQKAAAPSTRDVYAEWFGEDLRQGHRARVSSPPRV